MNDQTNNKNDLKVKIALEFVFTYCKLQLLCMQTGHHSGYCNTAMLLFSEGEEEVMVCVLVHKPKSFALW
jgi:hypothetical protein